MCTALTDNCPSFTATNHNLSGFGRVPDLRGNHFRPRLRRSRFEFLYHFTDANPETGNIDLTPLTSQEIRFEDVDSGETRVMNYTPVQAGNLFGVVIALQGYEVDNEDLYKERVFDFEVHTHAATSAICHTTGN